MSDYKGKTSMDLIIWHEVVRRPLTEEEKAHYAEMEMDDIEYGFDCQMPKDGLEILVATKWGTDKDTCRIDCDRGTIGLDWGVWDDVYAWAEMPQYSDKLPYLVKQRTKGTHND